MKLRGGVLIVPEMRAGITGLIPTIHGGYYTESSRALVDFSTCVNAFGPALVVRSAVSQCSLEDYPDRWSLTPRLQAASVWGCSLEEVAFGAGSAEFIQAVCLTYITTGDRAFILTPCFAEYARAVEVAGGRVSFMGSVEELLEGLRASDAQSPKLVFVASPTSPLGLQISIECLLSIADACREVDALLVLDQAYDAFAITPHGTPALLGHTHVFHLRSITKEHALAGLRAGFAISSPKVITQVETVRVPWLASAASQAATSVALSTDGMKHARQSVAQLQVEALRVRKELVALGFRVEPSDTHYMLIELGNALRAQTLLAERYGILVRDCTSFGLPGLVRIAVRTPSENDLLIGVMKAFALSDQPFMTSQT